MEPQDKEKQDLETEEESWAVLGQQHWRWRDQLKDQLNLSLKAEQRFHRHFIEKIPLLSQVGSFLIIWLVFIGLLAGGLLVQLQALAGYHTFWQPVAGGVYTEGLVGRATNFNPIYASSTVDKSVASLVFASPYRYNQDNELQPVLAKSLTVNDKASQYTLTLKRGLKWHDGQPITAKDLEFTIKTIQNPAAESPLRVNWQGVNVDLQDDYKIVFTLEASFSPFPVNLTLNVLPAHLLQDIEPAQLRSNPFNFHPVGAGPFIFSDLVALQGGGADAQELRIELKKNPHWLEIVPDEDIFLLNGLNLLVVPSKERLTELFNRDYISGSFDLLKEEITMSNDDYKVVNLGSMNAVYLFFKNSSPFCGTLTMRQVFAAAIDIVEALQSLDQTSHRIFGPLLPEHRGYRRSQALPKADFGQAISLLHRAGWRQAGDGWYKDGQKLSLVLTTQKDTDYALLAQNIKKQLERLQIEVNLDLRSPENISMEILQNHNYGDFLIYGLNLGSDADVYSYWHSSQIDSTSTQRLNLAEYRSDKADDALEAGRSRADEDLRYQRYVDFQQIWSADLPALPLYRLQFQYYTLRDVGGPSENSLLVNLSDRFYHVNRWSVWRQRQSLNVDG